MCKNAPTPSHQVFGGVRRPTDQERVRERQSRPLPIGERPALTRLTNDIGVDEAGEEDATEAPVDEEPAPAAAAPDAELAGEAAATRLVHAAAVATPAHAISCPTGSTYLTPRIATKFCTIVDAPPDLRHRARRGRRKQRCGRVESSRDAKPSRMSPCNSTSGVSAS